MLVGTDVCVRMVFVWEEIGMPGGNPPVWLGDHMITISHADAGYRTRVAAVRGECVNTVPARQPDRWSRPAAFLGLRCCKSFCIPFTIQDMKSHQTGHSASPGSSCVKTNWYWQLSRYDYCQLQHWRDDPCLWVEINQCCLYHEVI